jgi:hypothetical protein
MKKKVVIYIALALVGANSAAWAAVGNQYWKTGMTELSPVNSISYKGGQYTYQTEKFNVTGVYNQSKACFAPVPGGQLTMVSLLSGPKANLAVVQQQLVKKFASQYSWVCIGAATSNGPGVTVYPPNCTATSGVSGFHYSAPAGTGLVFVGSVNNMQPLLCGA